MMVHQPGLSVLMIRLPVLGKDMNHIRGEGMSRDIFHNEHILSDHNRVPGSCSDLKPFPDWLAIGKPVGDWPLARCWRRG